MKKFLILTATQGDILIFGNRYVAPRRRIAMDTPSSSRLALTKN